MRGVELVAGRLDIRGNSNNLVLDSLTNLKEVGEKFILVGDFPSLDGLQYLQRIGDTFLLQNESLEGFSQLGERVEISFGKLSMSKPTRF